MMLNEFYHFASKSPRGRKLFRPILFTVTVESQISTLRFITAIIEPPDSESLHSRILWEMRYQTWHLFTQLILIC